MRFGNDLKNVVIPGPVELSFQIKKYDQGNFPILILRKISSNQMTGKYR